MGVITVSNNNKKNKELYKIGLIILIGIGMK